ncbi:MAG: hypothetical protein AMS24_04240 [Chlamydiae bacterium SM23_39]|nr:MAG: hypothetical protein AMS24_04240 [Chlamydiae bacterium SM23_39]
MIQPVNLQNLSKKNSTNIIYFESINKKIKAIWMEVRLTLLKINLLIHCLWVSSKSRKLYWALVRNDSNHITNITLDRKDILLVLKFLKFSEGKEYKKNQMSKSLTVLRNFLLLQACQDGHLETVQELLNHPKIDPNINFSSCYNEGYSLSPLYKACEKDRLEIVKALLNHPKIDPNIGSNFSYCLSYPISKACSKGNLEIVKALLNHPKIDPNRGFIRDAVSRSCLFKASSKGNLEIVKALLNHPKIDPNKGKCDNDDCSLSPLSIAYEKDHLKIIQELLQHSSIDTSVIDENKVFYYYAWYASLLKDIDDFSLLKEILILIIAKTKIFIKEQKKINEILLKYALDQIINNNMKWELKILIINAVKFFIINKVNIPKNDKYIKIIVEKLKLLPFTMLTMLKNNTYNDLKIICNS